MLGLLMKSLSTMLMSAIMAPKVMKGIVNYIGSVASGMEDKKIAFTSPKGNIFTCRLMRKLGLSL